MKTQTVNAASSQSILLLTLLASLFVWSAFQDQLEAAYKYPIGIPEAWIDPDVTRPERPADWASEVPGYYYVDYRLGIDNKRPFGTPTAPRKTIPNPIPPGSRVEVNGLYNPTSGDWFITYAGTNGPWIANQSGPAWLCGEDATKRASFSGRLYHVGEYGCIDFVDNFGNYKATNINSVSIGKGRKAHHILLRNSEFKGTNSVGDGSGLVINGNSDQGGNGNHIVFYKNEVHGFGVTDPDGSDPDYIAVFVTDYCRNIWVLDNKLHDMSGSAMQVTGNSTSTPTTSYIYAARNECYNLWGTGMSSKTAEYIVYSQNHIYNVKDNGSVSPSKGVAGQYGASNQWIIFNRIHDCAHGILRVSGQDNVIEELYIIGNLIYRIHPRDGAFSPSSYGEAAICLWGANKNYVVNNTLYDVPQGIVTPWLPILYVENNLITYGNQADGMHFLSVQTPTDSDFRMNNNVFFQGGSPARIKLPNTPIKDTENFNLTKFGTNNTTQNPIYVNPTLYDLRLAKESPAIESGLNPPSLQLDVYALYLSTFGVSINVDFAGTPRPAGATWDIGAYEFSASPTGRLAAPSGLRIEVKP